MPNNGKVSRDLHWYLRKYFASHTTSGTKCETKACAIYDEKGDVVDHKRGDRERFTKIVGGPEILVIQLVRADWRYGHARKVKDRVQYPDRLDLSEYMRGDEDLLTYQLNGVVAHRGNTLNSGHYVAMVRSQRGDGFVLCDDIRIDDGRTKAEVLAQAESKEWQSYLLIYQKIGGKMAKCI